MRGAAYYPLSVICLSLSTYWLSARYYTSASFERPVHFTIITLSFTAISLLVSEYYWTRPRLRTLSYWAIIRTTQCSWPAIEAFLPLLSFLWEAIWPRLYKSQSLWPMPTKSQIIFVFLAALWPLSIISAELNAKIPTGTVCPVEWRWERFVPLIQLVNCLLDAAIISHTAHLARTAADDGLDIFRFMGKLCLAAAGAILLLSIPSWLSDSEFILAFRFRALDYRDFALDGVLATAGVLSGLSLLSSVNASCLALLLTNATFAGSQIPVLKILPLLSAWEHEELSKPTLWAIALASLLWYLAIRRHHGSDATKSRRLVIWLIICNCGLALLALIAVVQPLIYGSSDLISISTAIDSLISEASASSVAWESQASASKSLADAVKEYTKRYTVPPPPNFDKWYEFAKEHNSVVIDDFDQINNDLLPFWGLSPASLRERTASLFAYGSTEMGGLRIRNGSVEASPYIPGSHRWMADSLQRMIEPFAQWLPDMDLAINLADECRMVVPYERMERYKRNGQHEKEKVKSNKRQDAWPNSSFSQSPWPKDFTEPLPRGTNGARDEIDPNFTNNIRTPMFCDFVAPSCPQNSSVHNRRWWDWSNTCVDCLKPHSILTTGGPLLANVSLAHDLCHQPDVAYLSGFLSSPSAMVGTRELLPIFSQARVGGFSDILIPSPWNFDEKSAFKEDSGVEWQDKEDGLFWRGSRSDGFSAHGRWPGFLRPRFVHEAYKRAIMFRGVEVPTFNVSFTGEVSKCDGRDCAAETETYSKWGLATLDKDTASPKANELPPSVPFEEHWRYRHLFDMDGAGFSGRFLPFLESRSLPHRAALFRTWYDERLQAWHHYVPVDIRLGSGLWGSLGTLMGSDEYRDGWGPAMSKKIAEQGRDWAHKALRKEDMQIYMFRLLLEWGRITHDERDSLGFTM
ncbi:hypothetical protein TgHK011_009441 [Trichoderma gracile]|nr:hypothetical protein TgHK011_009441 [Trichoderma gracile]